MLNFEVFLINHTACIETQENEAANVVKPVIWLLE